MKITQEVRDYAEKNNLSDELAVKEGMKKKQKNIRKQNARLDKSMKKQNKTALVTGAGRGLGFEICLNSESLAIK